MATAIICALLFVARAGGQELPVYQMYLHHPALINPAVIGSGDCAEIALLDRHQWIGTFQGPPKTQVLAAETSVSSKEFRKHGLGLQLVNDANGATRQQSAGFGYAFHVTLNRRSGLKLGFGLMPMVYQATFDESGFSRINDPLVTWGVEREVRPDVSTGVFLYSERFFAGLSAVQLLASASALNACRAERGYFAHGGINLPASARLSLQPGLTVKYLSGLIQSDLNARISYRQSYWAMISYRHVWMDLPGQPGTFIIYAGLNYKNFLFGYGYDPGLTSMLRYGHGSHEFKAGYRFCRPRTLCPAFR